MSGWDGSGMPVVEESGAMDLPALALDQAHFAALTSDQHGIITYVNESFTRLTGYERHEAVGQSVRLLRSGTYDDAFYAGILDCLKAGDTWSDRLTVGRKDGGHYRSRSTAAPIRDDAGVIAGFSFFSRDTSDEARMEAQLGHLQKMEAIGEMASGIAHEINTPIQYIGDNIQFFAGGHGERDASRGRVFRRVRGGTLGPAVTRGAGRAGGLEAGNRLGLFERRDPTGH